MRNVCLLALVSSALASAACDEDAGGDSQPAGFANSATGPCMQNAVATCDCPDGTRSSQGCLPTGSWGACFCDDVAGAGGGGDGGGGSGGAANGQPPPAMNGGDQGTGGGPPPEQTTGGEGRQRVIAPDGTLLYGPHGSAINARDGATGQQELLLAKIAQQPVASWMTGYSGNIESSVRSIVTAAQGAGGVPVLVAYNIPGRDCGNYSAGGAGSADAYRTWIDGFAAGIGALPALVILEPDAITLNDCLDDALKQERYDMLKHAIDAFAAQPATAVYLDGGHSGWLSTGELTARLELAGVASARGFSINTSNFQTTTNSITYGDTVAGNLGGAHYLIDTSRNGLGPYDGGGESWCNPPGRALGEAPTTTTGQPQVDAMVWVKPPGESDGTCQGGPPAGQFWTQYAVGLAERASW